MDGPNDAGDAAGPRNTGSAGGSRGFLPFAAGAALGALAASTAGGVPPDDDAVGGSVDGSGAGEGNAALSLRSVSAWVRGMLGGEQSLDAALNALGHMFLSTNILGKFLLTMVLGIPAAFVTGWCVTRAARHPCLAPAPAAAASCATIMRPLSMAFAAQADAACPAALMVMPTKLPPPYPAPAASTSGRFPRTTTPRRLQSALRSSSVCHPWQPWSRRRARML